MRIKIFLNRVYLHSANMIILEVDARKFSIDKNNEGKSYITIDEENIILKKLDGEVIRKININNTYHIN